jgi:hypothetical protein
MLTWWQQRLLQLVRLGSIDDGEGVQVPGAADLELDDIFAPHGPCILPPRGEKEVLDLMDLLRLETIETDGLG